MFVHHIGQRASFYGDGFVHLKTMTSSPHTSLQIRFRTPSSSGLLFLAAGQTDFLLVELVSGLLQVTLELGSGKQVLHSESGSPLNDMAWHSITLLHEHYDVTLTMDNRPLSSLKMRGSEKELIVEDGLFLGGLGTLVKPYLLRNQTGFRGCIDKAVFNERVLLSSLRPCPGFRAVHEVHPGCGLQFSAGIDDPVALLTSRAYMALPPWNALPEGRFECLVRTSTQEGIILYSSAHQGGFVALEIREGLLVAVVGKGQIQNQLRCLSLLNDGQWHSIRLHFTTRSLTLKVDMETVQQERVLYVHSGSEDPLDSFVFSVFTNSDREAHNYLNENITYRYNITITPTNDAPELSLPGGTLFVLLENSKKLLTPDVIKATDVDSDSADLVFSVLGGPNADGGFLEHNINPGKAVTTFTHSDLEDGKVRYIHTGARNHKMPFKVSDGDKDSNTVVLRIMAIRLEYKIANNTGLEVTQGLMALIGSQHLAVQTNAINQTVEIRYDIIEPPQYGELQRLHSSGEWKPVSTFSQRLLEKERLKYLSTFGEIQSGNITDHFKYKVKVGPRDSDELVFPITVKWVHYKLTRNEILKVNRMRRVVLDSQHLHVIAQGVPLLERELYFSLTTLPKKGNLLLNNTILNKNSTFSQRDVTDLKVQYEMVDQPRIDTQDMFTFQVFSKHARSGNYVFRIAIEVDMDTIFLENNGLSVMEGGNKRVTTDALYSETLGAEAIYYTITNGPKHGNIKFYNSTLSRNSIMAFTNQDILEERITYIHDGSETVHDEFTFIVSANQTPEPVLNWSTIAVESVFNISVQPVNDEKPIRVVDKVFHVVRDGQKLLTLDDLRFHDPDSDFDDEQLVYTRRVVPMGELVMVNDTSHKLYRFLQKDLEQKQVLFVHRGVSSGRFVLFVSDGKHHTSTLLDVSAHDPYLKVANRTDLLVQKGQARVFSSSKFSVETNMDVRNDREIVYKMAVPPKHGGLYNGDKMVDSFTQQDLNMGHLFYRHDDSGNLKDSFNFTVAHEDGLSSEIVYTVKTPPAHGYLWRFAKSGARSSGTEQMAIGTFSQTDLNAGIIRYVQMEPGQTQDTFVVEATDGVTGVGDIHMLVDIIPLYIPLWVSSVTVQEGGSQVLSEEVIEVPDHRFLGPNLRYTVIDPPHQGHIEHTYFPGIPITTFTRKQVERELIHYVHDSSDAVEDSFTVIVSDAGLGKESLPQTVHVRVSPGNSNAPVITANRILRVWEGSSMEISPHDLCAWDKDTPPEELYFSITPPTNGHLSLKSTPSRHVLNFTQALINQGQLLFIHHGVRTGGFNFQVDDGVNFAPPQTFRVVATTLVLQIQRNRPLQVVPGSTTAIHRDDLLAVTNDEDDSGNHAVLFSVTSPPGQGWLVSIGPESTAEISSFTQEMVNEGVVAYKHKRRPVGEATSDTFTFTVSSPPAVLRAQTFHIHISPNAGPEGVNLLLSNTGAVVTEGEGVIIDKSKLDASNLLDRVPEVWRHNYEIWYRVTTLPKHGVIAVGRENLTNQNPTFSQSILNEQGITYLHDNSESVQDTFAFRVRLERKSGADQWWGDDREMEASFHITVTPVNDQPPLLKTLAPSLFVPQGHSVALGPDNLNVEDLDNPPEDIKYTVVREPGNGFLAREGRLDEPILAFTQADVNSGKVYFVHDGSPFSGLAYLSVWDGTHRQVYTLFHLQVSEVVSPTPNPGLILEQGQTSVILTRELLAAVTDEKDARIRYQVTRPPRYGKLLMDNEEATLFDQGDLWLGKVSYHMVDLSSSHDSFAFTAFMLDRNVTEQSVNITVKPLMRLGAGARFPNGVAVKLGKDFLDATVLAVLSGSDPQFEILPPQRHGEVVHILLTKDGASQPGTSFSFKDVEQGRLSITVTANLVGVQELNISIPFILKADNVQPARGDFLFTVLPNDPATTKDTTKAVPIPTLTPPILNQTQEDLRNTSVPRRPPKIFQGLNGRNRWGSHNRSIALLRNIPRANWGMRDITYSNSSIRAKSFPTTSSSLIIILPVLAFLLLTTTLVGLALVSCYHSRKQRAVSQNLSTNAAPRGPDPDQLETNMAPPSLICPKLTLSCPDSPMLGRPGGGALDPVAGLKDPSLLLCGLDHESAQLCLAANSALQHKQYWL
ncbi:hypothetical protein COCON_G00155100 [Conger conger]|uniref:Laminin G domain-containing protein n=1 Tax=Conger conger TaxID=82655 RepID=A0A9Q1D8Y2_CONCO|nr:hypothetical protein COCON_G00155100 [Conger conger]